MYLCYDEEYFDPIDNESQSKKYSEGTENEQDKIKVKSQ